MWRTAWVSLGLIGLAITTAFALTEGFEVWTAEGARRLAVIERPVPSPFAVLAGPGLVGPGLTGRSLPELWISDRAGVGRVTIVNFIYTRCPGVCLALGSSFQQLQRLLAATADDDVRLLSISFDPTHDGNAQLAQYALQWQADPRHWRIATVPDAQQLQQLLKAFQVTVIADGQGGYEHNAGLLVIDARGRLVRIFDADEAHAALAFARWLLARHTT